MTDTGAVLAIDQGGTSSRAIVFDADGQSVTLAQRPVATRRDAERVEHDAEEVVASVSEAVADALAHRDDVIAAGLATQRSSIVCWDRKTGAPLSPVLSWQDRRASGLLRELAPDAETLSDVTGLVPSPHYGASKLRWCLDNLPDVQRAARDERLACGPLAGFLLHRLISPDGSGSDDSGGTIPRVDPVNASRTLLWDVRTRNWSQPLLDAFGICESILPVCVPNRYRFGTLAGTAIPLTVCTGDQAAAVFAAGRLDSGQVIVNIGTGAFVLAPVDALPSRSRLLRSVVWDDGERVIGVLEGTVNGAASAIASEFPRAAIEDVRRSAERIGDERQSVLFLNGVSGLGSPFWVEQFPSRYLGDGDDSQRLTAVLESILFLLQVNLELVPGLTRREITVSGGLARNDGLCRGLAALAGVRVRRGEQPEATARGLAALTAGLGPVWRTGPGSIFEAVENRALSARYRRWRDAMGEALAAIE